MDDPKTFGAVAAANSLSDVYAMGGRPIVALNIVCFPTSCEPLSVLQDILEGGARKIIEAGAMLAGGHSVRDEEPKYGLVVFGEVDASQKWTVGNARVGDVLLLTKPVGTGIAITAIKAGLLLQDAISAACSSMTKLNNVPQILPERLRKAVSSCTDLTGFGLASHALDLVGDGVSLEISCSKIPLLPGIREMAEMGLIPAGAYSNKEFIAQRVKNVSSMGQFAEDIVYDPQTSGGLLIAAAPEDAAEIADILRKNGFPDTAEIGVFTAGSGGLLLR